VFRLRLGDSVPPGTSRHIRNEGPKVAEDMRILFDPPLKGAGCRGEPHPEPPGRALVVAASCCRFATGASPSAKAASTVPPFPGRSPAVRIPDTVQPGPQDSFTSITPPESHGRCSSASTTPMRRSNKRTQKPPARHAGWSHDWQSRWSHEAGIQTGPMLMTRGKHHPRLGIPTCHDVVSTFFTRSSAAGGLGGSRRPRAGRLHLRSSWSSTGLRSEF
jgi:hypothetical protein